MRTARVNRQQAVLPRLVAVTATIGLTVLAVLVGSSMGSNTGPAAAATELVAAYEMNEGWGASVMRDSGPHDLDGTIGEAIVTGITYDGAIGYRWPHIGSPTAPPAKPERIANVPSNSNLEPGTEDFAIEFRYRTTRSFGNVVQKGQNTTAGGYFKFEQPFGLMTCLFKDVAGKTMAVQSSFATKDGEWQDRQRGLDPESRPAQATKAVG